MPIPTTETYNNESIEVRSFEVTIRQVREDHHVYYSANAPSLGKTAQAYGHSPEAALAKLYDEVIPRITGLNSPSSKATIVAIPAEAFSSRQFRDR